MYVFPLTKKKTNVIFLGDFLTSIRCDVLWFYKHLLGEVSQDSVS